LLYNGSLHTRRNKMETQAETSQQTTLKVIATTGGFKTFVAFLAAMFIFLIVFLIGIIAGVSGFVASTEDSGPVKTHISQNGNNTIVAVLHVGGVIDSSNASYAQQAIDKILKNKQVRAIVLRVDSPGGGVTASDEIWHNIQRLKDAGLPLIASYGSVAASGGYYISCNADYILAQETTITGSIGVIASILTYQNLLEKIGVKPVTLIAKGSPEKSVANDVYRNWTVKDKQKVNSILDAMYAVFYDRVAEGRSSVITDTKKLKAVANGSAYTAQQALDNGLIDSIGYLDNAIDIAEQRASLQSGKSTVVHYSRATPSFGGLLGVQSSELTITDLRSMLQEFTMPKLMYFYNQ
ncbi:MAG: signal peptide peptidase SppA, partial [Phycisphaerales bacterium]